MSTFGDRLIHSRKQKKLSQDDLAKAMQKSGKAVISSWEVGRAEPSLTDLRKLAEVLDTTACWLLDGINLDQAQVMKEPPAGFLLVAANEYYDTQRKYIQLLEQQANRQQGGDS